MAEHQTDFAFDEIARAWRQPLQLRIAGLVFSSRDIERWTQL